MRRPIKSSVCALSLAVGAFFLTGRISCGQIAAEYRTRTEAAKQWPREAVRGAKAMVATDEELGSKAGVEILKRGGNAVDAAVADLCCFAWRMGGRLFWTTVKWRRARRRGTCTSSRMESWMKRLR